MFPENHAVLVVGEASTGLFEFCCYLGCSYLRNGEKVVFVENNASPGQVRKQMSRFGIEASDYEDDKTLVLVDAFTRDSVRPDETATPAEDRSSLPYIFEAVTSGIETVGGKPVRVILDSLTPLYVDHDQADVWRFFKDLSSMCKFNGTMTSVVNKGILDEDQIAQVAGLADGILEMRMDSEYRRYVRIKHLKGTIVSPKWVPFEFEKDEEDEVAILGWGNRGEEE
jgi:KaiC/GvpD/RAD55 family RecA-like ATPase